MSNIEKTMEFQNERFDKLEQSSALGLAVLQKRYDDLNSTLEKARLEVARKDTELGDMRQSLNTATQHARNAEKDSETLQEELLTSRKMQLSASQAHERARAEFDASMKSLSESMLQQLDKVSNSTAPAAVRSSDCSSLEKMFDKTRQELSAAFNKRLEETSAEMARRENELNTLLGDKSKELLQKDGDLANSEGKVVASMMREQALRSEVDTLRSSIVKLAEQRRALSSAVNQANEDLEAHKQHYQIEVQMHLTQRETLAAKIRALESMVKSWKPSDESKVVALESENERLKEEVRRMQKENVALASKEYKVAEKLTSLDDSCPKISCPRPELGKLQQRVIEVEAETKELRDSKEALQKELVVLRSSADKHQENLNQCYRKVASNTNSKSAENMAENLRACSAELQSIKSKIPK